MAITTLAEYKVYADIAASTWDTSLASALLVADEIIKDKTGRVLEQQDPYTVFLNGTGTPRLYLDEYPINAITSIQTVDASQTVLSTYDAVEDYEWNEASGIITLRGSKGFGMRASNIMSGLRQDTMGDSIAWPIGDENIKVIADVGYASGDMPHRLKYAVWKMMDSVFGGKRRDPSLASVTMGKVAASFKTAAEADAEINKIIQRYRSVTRQTL